MTSYAVFVGDRFVCWLQRISENEFANLDTNLIGVPVFFHHCTDRTGLWPMPAPDVKVYECKEIAP